MVGTWKSKVEESPGLLPQITVAAGSLASASPHQGRMNDPLAESSTPSFSVSTDQLAVILIPSAYSPGRLLLLVSMTSRPELTPNATGSSEHVFQTFGGPSLVATAGLAQVVG
jgi:hypothetical protein